MATAKTKTAGPKEAQLRELREGKSDGTGAHGKTPDRASIKARLDEARAKAEQEILAPYYQELNEAKERQREATAEVNELQGIIDELTGRNGKASGKAGGLRQRRSTDDLKRDAEAIVAMIKAAGKDGVSGSDIKAKFDITGSPKAFLDKHAKGAVKTTGEKALMRYTAA